VLSGPGRRQRRQYRKARKDRTTSPPVAMILPAGRATLQAVGMILPAALSGAPLSAEAQFRGGGCDSPLVQRLKVEVLHAPAHRRRWARFRGHNGAKPT
jgi:hypothetical protein